MAITWDNSDGKRYAYLASLTAWTWRSEAEPVPDTENTVYLCSASHLPHGWTDSSGNFHRPKMSRLRIKEDLGGYRYGEGGVEKQTASFRIHLSGYDDDLWDDLLFQNVLERARVIIWAMDRETLDIEYVFDGTFDGTDVRFKPNAEIPIRCIGGPGALRYPVGLLEEWTSAQIRGDVTSGNEVEEPHAPGRYRQVVFGSNIRSEATCFARDWEPASGDPGPLTDPDSIGLCPSFTDVSTFHDVVFHGQSSANVPIIFQTTVRNTNGAYNMVIGPDTFNVPWVDMQRPAAAPAAFFFHPRDADEHTAWVRGDWPNPSIPDIWDYLFIDATGYLQLGTAARDITSHTSFANDFDSAASGGQYAITFAYPHIRKKNEDIKLGTLSQILEEFSFILGVDFRWDYSNYPTNTIHKWFFEKREWVDADATTLNAGDFKKNTLAFLSDYHANYITRLNMQGAERYSNAAFAASSGPYNLFRRRTQKKTAAEETKSGIALHDAKMRWTHSNNSSNWSAIAGDIHEGLAQRHDWAEWRDSFKNSSLRLSSIIKWDVKDFPNYTMQIRYRELDFDRYEITYRATAAQATYT